MKGFVRYTGSTSKAWNSPLARILTVVPLLFNLAMCNCTSLTLRPALPRPTSGTIVIVLRRRSKVNHAKRAN